MNEQQEANRRVGEMLHRERARNGWQVAVNAGCIGLANLVAGRIDVLPENRELTGAAFCAIQKEIGRAIEKACREKLLAAGIDWPEFTEWPEPAQAEGETDDGIEA